MKGSLARALVAGLALLAILPRAGRAQLLISGNDVGNFVDADISILRLQGGELMQVGSPALPGHPASPRGNTP